jgi:hypothetical protein
VKERTGLYVVLGVALLTRIAHLAQYLLSADSRLYYWPVLAAARFTEDAHLLAAGGQPQGAFTYADPGYAYILAASFVTGLGPWPLLVFQLACGVFTALLVFKVALTAGASPFAGAASASLWALYAPAAFYELTFLSVSLTGVMVAVFVLASARSRIGHVEALVLGLISGLLCGLRPQLFPLLAIPVFLLARRRQPFEMAICLAAAAVPMILLAGQQRARGGPASPVATSAGFNLFIGHNPDADGFSPAAPSLGLVEDLRRDIHEVAGDYAAARGCATRREADAWFLKEALRWMAANPGRVAELGLIKSAAFFGFRPFDSYYDVDRVNRIGPVLAASAPRWLLVGIFCLGLLPFLLRGRTRMLLMLPIALAFATDLMSNHTERYSLPVLPLMCAVAGAGGTVLFRGLRKKPGAWIAASLAGLVLAVPAAARPVPAIPEGLYQQSMAIRAYQMNDYELSMRLFERSAAESPPGSYSWVMSHREAARIAAALGFPERAQQHLDALRALGVGPEALDSQ